MTHISSPFRLNHVRQCCRAAFAALLFALPAGLARAGDRGIGAASDPASCLAAIARTERSAQLPPALLRAIGMVESGRFDPQTRISAPWPWSINVEGVDHIFDNKDDAMRAVVLARASGVQSIDVGCMQINLKFHPQAFASLDEAFDPESNVTYAAAFLWRLRGETGNWPAAAAAYHSQTPTLANAYLARVATYWSPALGHIVPGAILPTRAAAPLVDRYDVMTTEQKARLVQDAADRVARNAALRVSASPRPPIVAAHGLIAARPRSELLAVLPATRARADQQAGLDVTGRWR